MKQSIAYYLIFFYAAALLKPVLPLVKDFLAHTFTQEHHIVTVHQHAGSTHVHKEIAATAKQHHSDEKAPKIIFSEPVSVHLSYTQNENCFPFSTVKESPYSIFLCIFSKPILDRVVPPPKFSVNLS